MAKQKKYKRRDNVLVIETTTDEPTKQEYDYKFLLEHRKAVESERDRVFQKKTAYMIELDEMIAEGKRLALHLEPEPENEE